MGKSHAGGKVVKARSLLKGQKSAGQFPINTDPTNEKADKQAVAIFCGLLALNTVLTVGGLIWCGYNLYLGVSHVPPDWSQVALYTIFSAVMMWLGRGFIWLSFFAAIMFANKYKAWKTQEDLCRKAIQYWRLFPGGAVTAALMLVQSLITRDKSDDAIAVGEEQWERYGANPKHAQNLAPMCTMIGLAYQMRRELKHSVTWNERAIEAYQKVLDQVVKPRGLTKLAVMQQPNLAKTVHMQLGMAYFNNGTAYFNQNNFRPAKDNYRKAVEHANQGPESAEKADILRASKEQLSRLKHT